MTPVSTTGIHRDHLSATRLSAGHPTGALLPAGRPRAVQLPAGRPRAVQLPAGRPTAGPGLRWPALRRAGDLLVEARGEPEGARRFALARLSALTTALAVSAGSVQDLVRARAAGPWALFASARPELGHWADVFAASDRQWAAICRGGLGSDAAADDLVVEAEAFRVAVLCEAVVGDGP